MTLPFLPEKVLPFNLEMIRKMPLPFLPEKVLPFNLEMIRKMPGTKPSRQLCHGVVQVITVVRPYCVLKIGFGEK